jgi:hypothetical protein
LKAVLDARRPEKAESTILRNTFGQPWTSDGFRASWGKAFDRAKRGDEDLHFHDLRGTAVTRLALAGCTVPQIAAITGHSPRDVDEILKAHYLGGQAELADQAIVKLVRLLEAKARIRYGPVPFLKNRKYEPRLARSSCLECLLIPLRRRNTNVCSPLRPSEMDSIVINCSNLLSMDNLVARFTQIEACSLIINR